MNGSVLTIWLTIPNVSARPALGPGRCPGRRVRSASVLLAALAWLAYFAYELGIWLRVLCKGECNIRVDLLLFYPVLLALSAWAVVAILRASERR